MEYRFQFHCSYRCYTNYQVYGDGPAYEIEVTRDAPAWLMESFAEIA